MDLLAASDAARPTQALDSYAHTRAATLHALFVDAPHKLALVVDRVQAHDLLQKTVQLWV